MDRQAMISVVVPVYNEALNIRGNLKVIADWLVKTGHPYEIIAVDDGSRDETWLCLVEAAKQIGGLRCLGFSRNFGKEAAMRAGLDHAKGAAVVLMDSDLQHPPPLLPEMARLWRDEGNKVVHCRKKARGRRSIFYEAASKLFYAMFDRLTGGQFQNSTDFRLLDRSVVDVYLQLTEKKPFFRGLVDWLGYKKAEISFEVPDRAGDHSKWTVKGLMELSLWAITSFSKLPLHLVTAMGSLFLVFAVILGIQTLVRFILGKSMGGFTTVILLLLIIGSVIMLSLGIIGEYIANIYDEIKARPQYVLERKTGPDA